MKTSFNLIKKFVDLEGLSAEEVAERLTFAGVEVEEVLPLGVASNLIIGEIIECVKHPDSDHLHILQVDEGENGIHQIVCGAPNARKGLKVIVALEGCKLLGGTITKSTIRGVDSDGMCCSLLELGVDEKYLSEKEKGGIEELASDAPVGERKVLEYLGLDDSILDIKVLANRPDLLSVLNIARELSGLFNRKLLLPEIEAFKENKTDYKVTGLCHSAPSFSLKRIKNVKNTESPRWLKSYLTSMGVRSIDALVDIGNYVMLVTGQPLNMYNAGALKEKELHVRNDFEGDFVALDEKTYKLENGDIVIFSGNEPVCLGGLMTSQKAAINMDTTDLVIEAAYFDATTIRHTSQRLGLSSESSTRFIKGINPFGQEFALNLATSLVLSLCGGEAEETTNLSTLSKEDRFVKYTHEGINNRLSTDFTDDEIDNVLKLFGFEIKENMVKIPEWRLDVTLEADLSEEVIRYYGTDRVKNELPKHGTGIGKMSEHNKKSRAISNILVNHGLDECLTYTLVHKDQIGRYNYIKKLNGMKIMNPLTDEHEYVRYDLLPSLLEVAKYNTSRKMPDLSLFEISDVYYEGGSTTRLAVVLSGKKDTRGLLENVKQDFYSVKGILECLMNYFGIDANRYRLEELKSDKNELHPYRSAIIRLQKDVLGVIGELHPLEKKRLGLENMDVAVMEIDLNILFNTKVSKLKFEAISKFPNVTRDLAFVVRNNVLASSLVSEIKKAGRGLIKSVDVFDVFEGASIGENMKSVALKVTYSSKERTLLDKDILEVEGRIKEALLNKFNATLRG